MGFQAADLIELCRTLARLPGVSGVWHHAYAENHGGIWVTVKGVDETAWQDRQRVFGEIVDYLRINREAIVESEFVFDHEVHIEHEALDDPLIPEGAKQIAA